MFHVILQEIDKKGLIVCNCTKEMGKTAVDMFFDQKNAYMVNIIKATKTLDTKQQTKLLKKFNKLKGQIYEDKFIFRKG